MHAGMRTLHGAPDVRVVRAPLPCADVSWTVTPAIDGAPAFRMAATVWMALFERERNAPGMGGGAPSGWNRNIAG